MANPKSYVDRADQWRREQLPQNESERRWQQWQEQEAVEQRVADRAREIIAEQRRQYKSLNTDATPEEVAAIDAAYKRLGQQPDWLRIRKAAYERAARARGREYYDEAKRVNDLAEQQPD